MESSKEIRYQVILTASAWVSVDELLEYLGEYYSVNRSEEIVDLLFEYAATLQEKPERGTKEKMLIYRKEDYRFILFKRTNRSEIKIIYYIDESAKIVYVTD